jgi:hypothetical protein
MGLLVIRHKVKDYSKWRPQFDRHVKAQRSAGLTDPRVFRSSDDPNEVVILFTTNDTTKAKDFVSSRDLKSTMAKAGVVGRPTDQGSASELGIDQWRRSPARGCEEMSYSFGSAASHSAMYANLIPEQSREFLLSPSRPQVSVE